MVFFCSKKHINAKIGIEKELFNVGIFSSIVFSYIEARQQAKIYSKSEAYAHLQSMNDQIEVMQRVCNASSCSSCKYGTSPKACEYNALVDLYNETLNDYAQRGLVKKG